MSNVCINTAHIMRQLKATIVQLSKMIGIENRCTVDESMEMVREILVKSQNEIMPDDLIKLVKDHRNYLEERLKKGNITKHERDSLIILNKVGIK